MNREIIEIDRPSCKTLAVYACGSMYRYDNLFKDHLWEVDHERMLLVMKINRCTGESEIVAYFRKWDYFVIEKH